MVEFKDIAGLSQPLTKLIEVVAEGVGAISRPYLARKNTDAKAYEIQTIAQAVFESQKLLGPVKYDSGAILIEAAESKSIQLPDVSTEKRISARNSYQESKRQSNLDKIVQHAADSLLNEQKISEESVDSDWTSRFFKIAEDITTDEMQILWGKVLAGEVKSPKSYSMRTLETLKNISKEEAEVFVKLAKFALVFQDRAVIFNPDHGSHLKEQYQIEYADLMLLEEIGLLLNKELELSIPPCPKDDKIFINCGKTLVVVDRKANTTFKTLKCVIFTEIGKQLIKLIDKEPADIAYIKSIAEYIKNDGISIKFGKILSYDGGKYQLDELKELKVD